MYHHLLLWRDSLHLQFHVEFVVNTHAFVWTSPKSID